MLINELNNRIQKYEELFTNIELYLKTKAIELNEEISAKEKGNNDLTIL